MLLKPQQMLVRNDQYILSYILSKDIHFNLIVHASTSAEALTAFFFSI